MADIKPLMETVESPIAQETPIPKDYAPSVPSRLNPDAPPRPSPRAAPAVVREQREKKDSLKKREATGTTGSPSTSRTKTGKPVVDDSVAPMRFNLSPHIYAPDGPGWHLREAHWEDGSVMIAPGTQKELRKPADQIETPKTFRYERCTADPLFRHSQLFRATEYWPQTAHMSVEDSDRNIHFDPEMRLIGNDKGWRTSRANVCAREGSLYYEVKIVKGIPQQPLPSDPNAGPQPHVRMGWTRREAPQDAPIGFDGYSYGITDARVDTMHRSRPGKFLTSKSKAKSAKPPAQTNNITPTDPLREGEVIGLLITLPPLPLHRKVVAGTYNPAVDFSSTPDPNAPPPDIVRDRIPIVYRNVANFEYNNQQPTRAMISYADRAPSHIVIDPPHPNHEEAALRSLPNSSIAVFRNGVKLGTAFEGLLAFLPPASAPAQMPQARTGLDDGSIGYFPAVSLFGGGIAEVNLGPDFWYPPAELNLASASAQDMEMTNADERGQHEGGQQTNGLEDEESFMKSRAISHRFVEQIAEDVVWDIIDEASWYVKDGGEAFESPNFMLQPQLDGRAY